MDPLVQTQQIKNNIFTRINQYNNCKQLNNWKKLTTVETSQWHFENVSVLGSIGKELFTQPTNEFNLIGSSFQQNTHLRVFMITIS